MTKKKETKKEPETKKEAPKELNPCGMSVWIKESGAEITLNNEKETVNAAKLNGWQLK